MEQCNHQYKSVIDTLAEEEGLPYTAAFTLFDADTDLWHMGSREPLSQRGPVNQGHFVGFRRSKELYIYNCASSQPPSSPRRQHHLLEIKLRTFPNSWSARVLSFNNRMNGSIQTLSPSTQTFCNSENILQLSHHRADFPKCTGPVMTEKANEVME